MLYDYSVTPLAENEIDARVQDIVTQVKRGAFLMPLFSMTLVPEGDPVWDKAGKMAKLYAKYRDLLAEHGVDAGILVQASLGHGYPITKNPFQPMVQLTDGSEVSVCCPLDQRFLSHFSSVLQTLAKERPTAIMLDDDFRLLMRPGRGCTCPLHMEEFNRRAGAAMTREELLRHIRNHGRTDRLARIFAATQKDALVHAAKVFREAIDEMDPRIQGINCTSGHLCESVADTNKIFAGKGNPTMVRVPNGCYAPFSVREFSDGMRQAAICGAKLRRHGIDIILAETDTIPFNRYAKSARYLHAHYLSSILEGLKGAKHWLTRTAAYEPGSGMAYRDILAAHTGLYRRLAELSDSIRWVGVSSFFLEQEDYDFNTANPHRYHDNNWITKNIERMGIPFYFSDTAEKASLLEESVTSNMTDDQIRSLLTKTVIMDGASARTLYDRGFGAYLGVRPEEWDLGKVSSESFDGTLYQCCTKQKNHQKLTVTDDRTEILSNNILRQDGYARILAPAVTVLERESHALSVVFCGSPDVHFNYMEGFSFLNESRKKQLVALLSRAGALPIYTVGDDEICLRAGYIEDRRLLAAIFSLGTDPIEKLTLYLKKQPTEIMLIMPDGTEKPLAFEGIGGNVYAIEHRVEILYPAVLLIR